MMRIPGLALLTLSTLFMMLLAGAASAQRMYKCESGGRVTYSGTKCKGARMTELRVQNSPRTTVRRSTGPQVKKVVVNRVERERQQREEAARQLQLGAAADAERARRCNALRLERDRTLAEADEAYFSKRDALRARAQQQRQAMSRECPG